MPDIIYHEEGKRISGIAKIEPKKKRNVRGADRLPLNPALNVGEVRYRLSTETEPVYRLNLIGEGMAGSRRERYNHVCTLTLRGEANTTNTRRDRHLPFFNVQISAFSLACAKSRARILATLVLSPWRLRNPHRCAQRNDDKRQALVVASLFVRSIRLPVYFFCCAWHRRGQYPARLLTHLPLSE